MRISLVRGAFLNPFELQNYYPLTDRYDMQAVSSLYPLNSSVDLPLVKLFSPTDLPDFPYKYQILNRLLIDIHYLSQLESVIKGSDIVHVAETYYHYTHQAIKAKLRGEVKKIVSTVWEVIPHNNEGIRGRKSFKALAYEHIDHFLAVTNLAKQALIKEGVSSGKITVIPMGVDVKRFSPAKKNKSTKSIQILFIGRLVEEKGVVELYEAYQNLVNKGYKIELKLVGYGNIYPPKNLAGITYSTLPYSRIQEAYQQTDIFCLPSKTTKYWQEQFGMVLVEAMSCGLPIVTTNTGAIQEVCEDMALYSAQGNANDLSKKLEKLVTNKELREKLGKGARQRVLKYFDSNKVAKKIDQLYQRVLSS